MYKQDDMAVCGLTDGLVKIKYGPYTSPGLGKGSYLVEWLEGVDKGMCSVVGAEDLEPAPKFKVGQKVKESHNTAAVVAGPFLDHEGDFFWVVQFEDGTCDRWWEVYMTAV